jgi:hypothetical protein
MAPSLNIHLAEGVVRLVAELCGITDDRGEKGKPGIVASMATRIVALPVHQSMWAWLRGSSPGLDVVLVLLEHAVGAAEWRCARNVEENELQLDPVRPCIEGRTISS